MAVDYAGPRRARTRARRMEAGAEAFARNFDWVLLGSVVALVGYGPGGFIVRSSWGADWGKDGYKSASEHYLAEATVESYGVVV